MAEETVSQKPIIDEVASITKDVDVFSGYLIRLENPDPILRTEAAGKGLKLYDEVDRDAHAGSVLQTRYLAVVGKEWDIIPAETSKSPGRPSANTREKVVADFVSSILEDCNFDQARGELLQGIHYGFYVCEVIWKAKGNAIVIDKIIGKHPRRFIFTPERELRLLTLQNFLEGETLPPRKFIVFVYGDSDNPYGKGLGQRLWWPVWFKKHGIRYWSIFLEKFGMPTAVGKYPAGMTTPEQKKTLLDALNAIQSETGITIPEDMKIEFLEAQRAGTVTHEKFEEYMDRQISKAVLGQTATTEGTVGKLGNEKAQEEVRNDILEADADMLDACLNETLIKWIVDFNFPGVTDYPKIKTFASPKPDLEKQSEIDERNVKAGVKIPMRYFYETYGYPAPEKGEAVAAVSATANAPVATGNKPEFAEGVDMDSADLIADRLARSAMKTTDEIYMAPLKRLTEKARTLDELRDSVIDLFGEMDPTELGILITQAMTLAEMTGRFEVADETGTLAEKKSPNSPRRRIRK